MVYLLRLKYVPDINGETGVLYDKFGTKKNTGCEYTYAETKYQGTKSIAKLINRFTFFLFP